MPGTALWYEKPFVDYASTTGQFLVSAVVITALNAAAVLLFLFLWIGVLQKGRDYIDTFKQFGKISKWFFLGAVCGGPVAIFGSFLAMGYIGGVFAAVAALLYPAIGATIARLWYHEKISGRAAFGIFLIIVGGITAYAPGILGEISKGGSGAWLGYLGGFMAAVGWGIEGAIAGRALDVTDPDIGITVRFTGEVLIWWIIVLPLVAIFTNAPVGALIAQTISSPMPILLLIMAGITFGYCYVSWYKSFPLIGVGRGQAIGDLYGMFAIVFMTIFTLVMPKWNFFVAAVISIVGGFLMITESSENIETMRSLPEARQM